MQLSTRLATRGGSHSYSTSGHSILNALTLVSCQAVTLTAEAVKTTAKDDICLFCKTFLPFNVDYLYLNRESFIALAAGSRLTPNE